MKLLYFTTEDIGSGLFENQVLEKLYGILERDPSINITLFVLNKPSHYLKHQFHPQHIYQVIFLYIQNLALISL